MPKEPKRAQRKNAPIPPIEAAVVGFVAVSPSPIITVISGTLKGACAQFTSYANGEVQISISSRTDPITKISVKFSYKWALGIIDIHRPMFAFGFGNTSGAYEPRPRRIIFPPPEKIYGSVELAPQSGAENVRAYIVRADSSHDWAFWVEVRFTQQQLDVWINSVMP
jgi:hypothetical protein